MDKKLKAANVADCEIQTKRTYLPPEVEMLPVALEKGFAVSPLDYQTDTEALDYYDKWDQTQGSGDGELFF